MEKIDTIALFFKLFYRVLFLQNSYMKCLPVFILLLIDLLLIRRLIDSMSLQFHAFQFHDFPI